MKNLLIILIMFVILTLSVFIFKDNLLGFNKSKSDNDNQFYLYQVEKPSLSINIPNYLNEKEVSKSNETIFTSDNTTYSSVRLSLRIEKFNTKDKSAFENPTSEDWSAPITPDGTPYEYLKPEKYEIPQKDILLVKQDLISDTYATNFENYYIYMNNDEYFDISLSYNKTIDEELIETLKKDLELTINSIEFK